MLVAVHRYLIFKEKPRLHMLARSGSLNRLSSNCKKKLCIMASTQKPKLDTSAIPHTAQFHGYRVEPSSPIDPDTIGDILGCCLIWILPAFFFAGIIVLGTMLISHTLVMRIPLPRQFALIIVIFFAGLITITIFLLMAFHFRRCHRRILLPPVRFTLSETSSVAGKGVSESRGSSHSSNSQMPVLNVGAVAPPVPASAQDIFTIPLRRVKCYANIKQAAQDQDSNKALEGTVSLHDSLPSSSHSSVEINTLTDNQWSLRQSPSKRLPPLAIPPHSGDDAPPLVSFEEEVYYLPPGPPSPIPSAGIRPFWADDIEKQLDANLEACVMSKRLKALWARCISNN